MIETSRLILRDIHLSDVDTIVRELNNFNIARNTARIPFPYHRDDALDFINFIRTLDNRSLTCAITDKSNPAQMLGIVSYEFSIQQNDAELGYWLAESHWRKGIMTEAVAAIVDHAFNTAKLEKLVSCYHNDNPVSGRILRGIGFVEVEHCTSFSKAQGKDVAVTNLKLSAAEYKKGHKP
jgi:RimJ/RimL family protein N-acetyltransferase